MIQKALKLAAVAALLLCSDMAVAQHCGCLGGGRLSGKLMNLRGDNCGRGISQYEAEAAWANYCNEDCSYAGGCNTGCDDGCGSGCRLGGKLKGMFAGRGNAGGCSTCDMGCFGYPAACDGGCGGGMLAGGHFAGRTRGCGCKLGGKLKGMFATSPMADPCGMTAGCGCKIGGKLKGLFSGSGSCFFGGCGLFSRSRSACGHSGAYFGEAVGYEYGNAGMQSCVSGCTSCVNQALPMTSGCCGSTVASPAAPSVGTMPAAPAAADPVNTIPGEGQAMEATGEHN